ncbi:MAG: hypothetical protein ICV69_15235 [Thermoleophilaceae bacterium]|nr:hypothetical protein [Thermoleophilaceae bacterium]
MFRDLALYAPLCVAVAASTAIVPAVGCRDLLFPRRQCPKQTDVSTKEVHE